MASAMAFAAALLSARTPRLVVVRIERDLGVGLRFGFSAEEPTFPVADFALQVLDLLR